MGQIVGGIMAVYLFSKLLEWAVIKRVMGDPLQGVFTSVFATYFIVSVLYGFTAANGGQFQGVGFLLYLPGAVIVGLGRYYTRKRAIERSEAGA